MTHSTTLITGAGVRIGAEIAKHLAGLGHDLVLHFNRSGEAAMALAESLTAAHGTKVTLVQADLADARALANFWDELPPVHHIIHNAARYARDTLSSLTAEDLRTHLAVNLEAPLLLTQGFLAQLPGDVRGNVIVLGDGNHGWSLSPEFFSYSVSKIAWESVIDLLAAACAPRARANVIALGTTLTGTLDDEAMFARLAARAPLARNNTPHEVCAAIEYLLGCEGVTGQTLSLGNGFGLATARPSPT